MSQLRAMKEWVKAWASASHCLVQLLLVAGWLNASLLRSSVSLSMKWVRWLVLAHKVSLRVRWEMLWWWSWWFMASLAYSWSWPFLPGTEPGGQQELHRVLLNEEMKADLAPVQGESFKSTHKARVAPTNPSACTTITLESHSFSWSSGQKVLFEMKIHLPRTSAKTG